LGSTARDDGRVTSPLAEVRWPVTTRRLSLRPSRADDLEATWRYRQLEAVNEWITSAPSTLDAYRKQWDDPNRLAKTIVIELDDVVIGDLMLAIEDAWSQSEVSEQAHNVQAELGWCLAPDYAGNGYATEAVTELIRLCFEELGIRRIIAQCFAANEASWRLMERVGMRREVHAVSDSLHRSGEWMDGYGYALLAQEWPGAREPGVTE
jgi:RimJ/RimL family protein N-acetyltransferase